METEKNIMKKNKKSRESQLWFIRIISFFMIGLMINMTISSVYAADSTSFGGAIPSSFTGNNYQVYGASINPQFSQPEFYGGYGIDVKNYWSNFDREDCEGRQDVILMIPPGGCSPAVVRSDLLEEQNVPVFCKVSSIQINPLIDITKIRSIHFKGEYPEGVSGLSYYPARAAVRSTDKLIGSPVVDNVGYLVVILKKTPNEKDMPDWLGGNVTAVIDYDSEGVFGVGEHDFFLSALNEEDWQNQYKSHSFWKGKGFIRAESIDAENARISIYKDATHLEASVNLKKGETSRDLYLDGYYCAAGMNIKLEDISYPVDKALLRVDDEELWVSKGGKFLDGRCSVRNIQIDEVGSGKVSISCPGSRFDLLFNKAVARFEVEKTVAGKNSEDDYKIGEKITSKDGNDVYLAYSGKYPNAKNNYNVLVAVPSGSEQFKGLGAFIYNKQKYWQNGGFNRYKLKNILGASAGGAIGAGIFAASVVLTGGATLLVGALIVVGGVALGAAGGTVSSTYFSDEERDFYVYLIDQIVDKYPELSRDNFRILIGDDAPWPEYGITLKKPVSGEEVLNANPALKEYYEKAIKEYDDLFEFYPGEKFMNEQTYVEETYAAQALSNAADLAGMLGLKSEQQEHLEKLIEKYPDSKLASDAKNKLKEVYDERFTKDSQAVVYVNNEPHFISLINAEEPSYQDLGAELLIEDKNEANFFNITKDELSVTDNSKLPFKIKEIKEDSVNIEYYDDLSFASDVVNYVRANTIGKTKTIELGKTEQITKDVTIKLVKVNLNKIANVKIIPKVFGARTESDFSFKIGIEKRGIKLSPEKTQEMIDNLNKTIKQWEDINNKLSKVVKGLKAACFATSAMLTIKNLFSGWSGESMARNAVMTSRGGWNDKCEDAIANKKGIAGEGPFTSVETCLLKMDEKGYIKADIEKYKTALENKNKEIETLQEPLTKKTDELLDFEGQVDYEQLRKNYCTSTFINFYNTHRNMKINLRGEGEKRLDEVISPERVTSENCDVDFGVMKDLTTFSGLGSKGDETSVLYDVTNNNLGDNLLNTYQMNTIITNQGVLKKTFGDISVFSVDENVKYQVMSDVSKVDTSKYRFGLDVNKVFADVVGTQSVLVGLANKKGDRYVAKQVLDSSGNDITGKVYTNATTGKAVTYGEYYSYYKHIDEFTLANAGLYKNPMKGEVKVKYYETAPYKGLPQLVPFDRENGWYATSDYILSGFGKPYEQSGRAVNFWICNVGENGIIEGKSRDDCRYYNLGSTADLDFPGLSKTESSIIVKKAETAIRQASEQYGKSKVVINNQVFDTGIAQNGETGRCSDFMSPKDCNIMFNVCDPVICPESRCDFGGKYRVANVIQSGIIGSLLLCLPNAQEGIAIPICLSGVNAGIEGWLSILKTTQACLKENLETGRNIGICDEMKSIYMCDFFWRQAVPLMDVGIPKLFESLAGGGQGARGGGEYLTVNSAWENAKNSIDWFKNEYAVNAMKAFNARSTSEIGGEVCKSFVSARYPSNKDFFDNLIEPDSPVQYSAWFSEDILTEATIPSTSHYKVYYHIYAGKDIGSHYVVYLKNPPESSYVHTMGTYVVDRGYIERGKEVDQARDFTSISGYTQLCVNINGQEECGFKQVSTSWAVDEISNRYANEQASATDISTSKACVAGETSLYSLANPNLQAGAQEAISPELYKRGIIRVCSSDNPGKQVLPSGELDPTNSTFDRWKKVGYCDDQSIGCWLDTNSVEEVLRDAPGLLNETLDEVNLNYLSQIDVLTEAQSKQIIQNAKKVYARIGLLKAEQLTKSPIQTSLGTIEGDLDTLSEKGFVSEGNSYKAQGLLWKGRIYGLIAKKIYYETVLDKKVYTSIKEEEAKKTQEQKTAEEVEMEEVEKEVTQWNLDSAIEALKTKTGKYSDNKEFIDEIYQQNLLTDTEYNEIRGTGFGGFGIKNLFTLEKDMAYVKTILLQKKAAQARK